MGNLINLNPALDVALLGAVLALVPVGIVAQIQGHKPSAIAEKHYRVRPIDLLGMWHEKIEAWMLEQAGIEFDASKPKGLHVVSSA